MERTSAGESDTQRPAFAHGLAEDSVWRALAAATLALAAILFFARLGVRSLWASEYRWGEIAREMILTRNYFWPTINGHVYYDKPLGSYWLVVAATWLTGGMNETAARLPSAIAGLAAVALVIALGRRLYDLRTGVSAAFILATSFSFVFFSRHADADVETITGELAALLLFWRNQGRPNANWIFGLWLILALTSLTKGLLGFILPLLVIGLYATLRDGFRPVFEALRHGPFLSQVAHPLERNRWFFNWRTPLAGSLAALIYYAPFAVSHAATGSNKGLYMVYRENVERYFAPFDHVGPIYLYVYVIFGLMAPWSVFLPAALLNAYTPRDAHPATAHADRFVLIFFWATFIFFTLSGSRRSYYLLPILPAAALLVARLFAAPMTRSSLMRATYKLGFAVLALMAAASTLVFIPPRYFMPHPYDLLPDAPYRAVFAIYWFSSVAVIVLVLRRFSPTRVLLASSAIAWLFMWYLFVFAMPAGDAWRGEKPFAREVRVRIGANTESLAFFRNSGPAYYLDLPNPVPSYATIRQLDSAVASGRTRWVVVRDRDVATLGPSAQVVAREAVFPWDSTEHRLNAMVLVRVTP